MVLDWSREVRPSGLYHSPGRGGSLASTGIPQSAYGPLPFPRIADRVGSQDPGQPCGCDVRYKTLCASWSTIETDTSSSGSSGKYSIVANTHYELTGQNPYQCNPT